MFARLLLMLVFLSAQPRSVALAADGSFGLSTEHTLAGLFQQWAEELQKGLGDQLEHATLTGQTSHLTTAPAWRDSWESVNNDWNQALHVLMQKAGQRETTKLKFGFSFTIDNTHAVKWATEQSAKRVTQVTTETQAAIRAVVGQAFKTRIPPRDLAKLIEPTIGLTDRSAQAVVNRAMKDLADGKDAAQVRKSSEKYAKQLLKQRATTIARTETMAAQNAGTQASWQTAKDKGLIPPGAKRRWIIAAGSDRTCEVCTDFGAPDNRETGLNDPFTSTSHGELQQPPAHPNCRCTMGLAMGSKAKS